jgi:hypothetical protein
MKWKPLAALGLALAGWTRFSKTAEEAAPEPEYVKEGEATDPCPPGKYRVWGFAEQAYVCIPYKK